MHHFLRSFRPGVLRLFVALTVGAGVIGGFSLDGAGAQEPSDEVVVFVLDLSGSMNEPFDSDRSKLDVAKAAFVEAFANVSDTARVGLRTYGDSIEPTTPDLREPSCTTDTRLASPVAAGQRGDLIDQVQGFSALGDTPMGLALQQAATDIPPGARGTVVLFSDGRDECFDADLDGDPTSGPSFGQDPCEIAKAITAESASIDRVVTVGFRADTAAETELRCIAEATGGSYTAIQTPEDARDVLPELLIQLSAPRVAQVQQGRPIEGVGVDDRADAPALLRLDEINADAALYTDTLTMNVRKYYRIPQFGPDGATFTATVFGLPEEPGIEFDMYIWVEELEQRFFEGEFVDLDAGVPARPTSSIRCTDCRVTGGPFDAHLVLWLRSENEELEGTFDVEILTEGPGVGGPPTSCSAPQECFYPAQIEERAALLAELQAAIDGRGGSVAPAELIAERDRLSTLRQEADNDIAEARARTAELQERLATAPTPSNSWRIPLLLMLVGVALAFAPVHKLRRDRDPEAVAPESESEEPTDAPVVAPAADEPAEPLAATMLDVGPTPEMSDTAPRSDWQQELEAAKAALAEQRPDRSIGEPDDAGSPPPPTVMAVPPNATAELPGAPTATPSAEPPAPTVPPNPMAPGADAGRVQFTPEQHAAAKAAAEQIAAQRAAEQAAADASAPEADGVDDSIAGSLSPGNFAAKLAEARSKTEEDAAKAAAEAAAEDHIDPTALVLGADQPTEAERAEARRKLLERQSIVATSPSGPLPTDDEPADAQDEPPPPAIPPGWYPDPRSDAPYRWWDGNGWTTELGDDENAPEPS